MSDSIVLVLRRLALGCRAVMGVPLLLPLLVARNRSVVLADCERWSLAQGRGARRDVRQLLSLLSLRDFRTVYLYRLRHGGLTTLLLSEVLSWLYPGEQTLLIWTAEIGPGLYIQHGIATIVAARRIGANAWINQQVTIGYTNATDTPELGDNVTVGCGAKILGKVHVGDGAVIGANAVVVKNVPPRCTVVGVPARIVRREGVRVNESL